MREQLEKVAGVESCSVDWEKRQAICAVESGTDPEKVASALDERFAAKVVR